MLVDNLTNHWTARLQRWRCGSLSAFMRLALISIGPIRRSSFWSWTKHLSTSRRRACGEFCRWQAKSGRRNCVPRCSPGPLFSNSHT
jgi:hypothetical protein